MNHIKLGETVERPGVCPVCDAPLDAATQILRGDQQQAAPKVGDITSCIECCTPLVFAETGLSVMTAELYATLSPLDQKLLTLPKLLHVLKRLKLEEPA